MFFFSLSARDKYDTFCFFSASCSRELSVNSALPSCVSTRMCAAPLRLRACQEELIALDVSRAFWIRRNVISEKCHFFVSGTMRACQDSRFKERLFAYQRLLGGVLKCLLCRRSALPGARLLPLRWFSVLRVPVLPSCWSDSVFSITGLRTR